MVRVEEEEEEVDAVAVAVFAFPAPFVSSDPFFPPLSLSPHDFSFWFFFSRDHAVSLGRTARPVGSLSARV